MTNFNLEERMKASLAKSNKVVETMGVEVISSPKIGELEKIQNLNIYTKEDFSFIDDIVEDVETREYLKEKTKAIFSVDRLSKVVLGKYLNEVFEKIGKQKIGIWDSWCEAIGINDRTAYRYRKRGFFFDQMETTYAKKIAVSLRQEDIEFILDNEELFNNVKQALETGASKEVIKMFIKNFQTEELDLPKTPSLPEMNIENIVYTTTTIQEQWETFEPKKKKKLQGLLRKIQKIMQGE